ncbi:hypothetical protein I302_101670 [Kwoniella bestiolae CBS 10118]|uniref:Mmc1 C-terminal domain-containing protein n=1 Tax=Kwoniella bestiolae CBS 10118 TaxID=1296100 RepID=A0A1B9GCX8_9TREE|nr:hypothetical protein I302_00347 [Kwoniella bestiolae CBS 10118]OCF28857.1 hypothetical protein I302_00347 [Kwoniella bestiolae CBS 10118]
MSLTRLVRSAPRQVSRISSKTLRPAVISSPKYPSSTTSSQNSQHLFSASGSILIRRYASAATAIKPSEPFQIPVEDVIVPKPVSGAGDLIPILQDIQDLLEQEIGGDDIWSRRIRNSLEDLQSARRGRIAVIGDALAAPRDVVSALLQDPLADTEASRRALLTRHEGSNIDVFQIGHGPNPHREPESLSLSASWLQSTGYDVIEVNTKKAEDTLSTLLSTDSLLVVLDPIRLTDTPQLSSILPLALSRGSIHLVINGHLPPNTSQTTIEAKLRDQLSKLKVNPLEETSFNPASVPISFVKAEKALDALDALAAGLQEHGPSTSTSKTRAFEVFQNQFLESHIGPLQSSLLQSLTSISEPQLSTSRQVAGLALSHIENIIASDRDIVKDALHTVSELRRGAQQGASKAKHLSVASRGIEGGLVEGSVEYDMNKVQSQLEEKFNGRLSWLGLIGRTRVDDVQFELTNHLNNNFATDLERQIIFESGQLSHLQLQLNTLSDHTIRQLSHSTSSTSTHPFTSPLLLNHLSTLSLSIPPLTPTSLTSPISTRRQQLLTQSIPRLHSSAQRALLTTYATSLLGVSLSWMSYVPPIALTSASTALGLGILSVVASLALGQRLWGKAQKKFWRDWKRITGMMKGDLETRFDTALRTQVLAKPLISAEGLEKLIQKREKRLDELQDKVNGLSKRI